MDGRIAESQPTKPFTMGEQKMTNKPVARTEQANQLSEVPCQNCQKPLKFNEVGARHDADNLCATCALEYQKSVLRAAGVGAHISKGEQT
jgi:hypothetical protein